MQHPTIFVLWGENFAEVAATVFVSELRQAGLCTRLVGLSAQPVAGVHGLRLVPDLTLSQAVPLAQSAACVVLPCSWVLLHSLRADCRLDALFQHAALHRAQFLIGSISSAQRITAQQQWPALAQAQVYPTPEALVPFVRRLPTWLNHKVNAENCANLHF